MVVYLQVVPIVIRIVNENTTAALRIGSFDYVRLLYHAVLLKLILAHFFKL